MARLILCNMYEIINIKISYCLLVCIYLFIFSPQIKRYSDQEKLGNLQDVIVNLIVLLVFNITIFSNNICVELQMFLLMLWLVFYNKFILLQNFKLSMLTSSLYWGLGGIPALMFLFVKVTYATTLIECIIIFILKYLLSLTFFIIVLYRVIIPVIRNGILLKICYPKNRFLLVSYWLLLAVLAAIPVYVYFLHNNHDVNNYMHIVLESLCLVTIISLLVLIYFLITRLQQHKVIEDLKEMLVYECILVFSAAKEERLIKNISTKARAYSCQTKACILRDELETVTEDCELYCSLKKDLSDFYKEYSTGDDVIDNILSKKYLICNILDIELIVKTAMLGDDNVELEKLKNLYAIFSTSIDVVIVDMCNLNSNDKNLTINILNFGKNTSVEIVWHRGKEINVTDQMFIKNKIFGSNKYQYLYYMVKKLKGRIFLKANSKGFRLIITCE